LKECWWRRGGRGRSICVFYRF